MFFPGMSEGVGRAPTIFPGMSEAVERHLKRRFINLQTTLTDISGKVEGNGKPPETEWIGTATMDELRAKLADDLGSKP